MAGYSPEDFDYAVRTVWGEARGEPTLGQQSVAAVIRNRAKAAGTGFKNVVLAPNQFEPWGSKRDQLLKLSPQSPEYQRIADSIRPIFDSEADPTNGATHFYSPKVQAALGRKPPSWDNGTGFEIGTHRFFKLGSPPSPPPAQGYDMYGESDRPTASAPISTGSNSQRQTPMADPQFSGISPEEVAQRRRYAQQSYQRASDASPVGHWTQALSRVMEGANAGIWNNQAQEGEAQGRKALVSALMNPDPAAGVRAAAMTPWGADLLPVVAQSAIKQADPMYEQQLKGAKLENQVKERELNAPKMVQVHRKEGEDIGYADPRDPTKVTWLPAGPNQQPLAEKKRMEERVQLEEKERAKALARANEADEMARELRSTMGHIVGDGSDIGPDGKPLKTYGEAPSKVFGVSKDGKPLQYKVSPEIFGPYEASGLNTNLQAGSPTASRLMDMARGGGFKVSPEERNRQRGVLAARLQTLNAVMTKAQNEGQGAVTNYEREMYAQAVADMKSGDVQKAYSILRDLDGRFSEKAKADRLPYMQDSRPSLVPPTATRFSAPADTQGSVPLDLNAKIPGGTTAPPGATPSSSPILKPGQDVPVGGGSRQMPQNPETMPQPGRSDQPQRAPGQGRRFFENLHPNDRRKAITTLARDFNDPRAHEEFIAEFGTQGYQAVRALAEKLRKGVAL